MSFQMRPGRRPSTRTEYHLRRLDKWLAQKIIGDVTRSNPLFAMMRDRAASDSQVATRLSLEIRQCSSSS